MTITQEDRALLNTNFGEDIEKIAEQHASAISEAYQYGFSKIAKEMADEKDKEDKEEKKEHKEEKMDEESEKAAAELGAFIERGFFDGLRKLGAERHGNEFHYIEPFILEKTAASAKEMGAAVMSKLKGAARAIDPRRAVDELREGGRAVGRSLSKDLKQGTGGYSHLAGNDGLRKEIAKKELKGGAKDIGVGLARLSPYAALGGGAIYGGAKLVGGSDKGE